MISKLKIRQLKTEEKSGFTLVEFSLVTAFMAVLLIAVAIITASIIQLYQKGLTIKAVNSVGRGLIDEFIGSVNAAPAVDTSSLCRSYLTGADNIEDCERDHAYKFVYQQRTANRSTPGESSAGEGADNTLQAQLGGVFCTGKYSYVWNTYYGLEGGRKPLRIRYLDQGGADKYFPSNDNDNKDDKLRLFRFPDETYRLCSTLINTSSYNNDANWNDGVIDIRKLANGNPNKLKEEPQAGFLSSFNLDLVLYEFVIFPISQDWVTQRTFMSGTFILATERGNINIERSGNYCDIHHLTAGDNIGSDDTGNILDVGAEFNYCAINRFNFAARTAGM